MTTARVSAEEGKRRLSRLARDLELRKEALAAAYARALLDQAQGVARGKPTPQSRMAAEAMGVRGSTITVLTGGAPADVSGGSEWGSNIYRQFGPRNEGGYWLHPSADNPNPATVAAGEHWMDDQVEGAVRGF